jgi:pimeloyl-ACP methyl ester carboxylesterase
VSAPERAWRIGQRILRGIGRAFGALFVLLAILALAGASYEAIAGGGDAHQYPPPGQLVDVGGYRLHIDCVGEGSPTVVLESGLGGSSLDWRLVQPELGKTTRVCAYDRAGMGWSNPSPQPRTPRQIADELHMLLTNAGIAGPYVLVGHSLGGKNVRLFALTHPDQVAGMVLVDARSEYMDANTSAADTRAFKQALQTQGRLYWVAGRLGIARLFGAALLGPPSLPVETRAALALSQTRQNEINATTSEGIARAADDGALQATPSLGDRPLIVLAAGQNVAHDPIWLEAQCRLAALSSDSRLIIAEGSGHFIQWDQPTLVIETVRQVIEKARSR